MWSYLFDDTACKPGDDCDIHEADDEPDDQRDNGQRFRLFGQTVDAQTRQWQVGCTRHTPHHYAFMHFHVHPCSFMCIDVRSCASMYFHVHPFPFMFIHVLSFMCIDVHSRCSSMYSHIHRCMH